MAGLLSSTVLTPPSQPPGQTGMPQEFAEDTVGDDEGKEPATPEEQEAKDAFVKEGLKLIYEGGEVRPTILEFLDEDPSDLIAVLGDTEQLQNPTPPVTLAATTVMVVLEVIRRAGPENKPDDLIIFHGGVEILEDLANLATEAGVHDYSQDEINTAWLMAQDIYREAATAQGLVDPDALKGEFDEIVTADKNGQLGDVLPALANAQVREQQPEGMA